MVPTASWILSFQPPEVQAEKKQVHILILILDFYFQIKISSDRVKTM